VGQGTRLPAMKELWCFTANRISVRFKYESHGASGQW
jgi:nuclear transport factor 2 (NTF2) superfamily protein